MGSLLALSLLQLVLAMHPNINQSFFSSDFPGVLPSFSSCGAVFQAVAIFTFDIALICQIISSIQINSYIHHLSARTLHNKRINQKCNRIQLALRRRMSQYEQSRIGRIKRRKRWYWNISDKTYQTILKESRQQIDFDTQNTQPDHTGVLRTGCLCMKSFLFATLTTCIRILWLHGQLLHSIAFWLARLCWSAPMFTVQLLKAIYAGTYCCCAVVLRELKSGHFQVFPRDIICMYVLCYSLWGVFSFDSLHNPGKIGLFRIIIDSGVSFCYTFDQRDFPYGYTPIDPISVKGIAKGLTAIGKGIVRWHVTNVAGEDVVLELEAYLLPNLPVRLLSPQQLARKFPNQTFPTFGVFSNHSVPSWAKNSIKLRHDRRSNLPVLHAESDKVTVEQTATLCSFLDGAAMLPLTAARQELLQLHQKLAHMPMKLIQLNLCGDGGYPEYLRKCKAPMCASCQYGKQTKRPVRKKESHPIKSKNFKPGFEISVDQLESSVGGRQTAGNGKSKKNLITVCTLFVDHCSQFMFAHPQSSTSAAETLEGKSKFERCARSNGVAIKNYQADNGSFASAEFTDDVKSLNQNIRYCAPGAHHQNGVAERHIRTVSELSRSMMIDAACKWPGKVTTALWPFAVLLAVDIWNNVPRGEQGAPIDTFSNHRRSSTKDFHPFGCPVFILNRNLQNSKKIPRWDPCCHRGIYLGRSPNHADNVALVLNLTTGHITAQFHVVFDDNFETINSTTKDLENSFPRLFLRSRPNFDITLRTAPHSPSWRADSLHR